MRLLVQRALRGEVEIDEPDGTTRLAGRIDKGLVVFAGFGAQDGEELPRTRLWTAMIDKLLGLRIFPDEEGRFNRSLDDAHGGVLLVSQFTLYADTSSRRPGFTGAAKPDLAIPLYQRFLARCRERGFEVRHGEFGADMQVASVNDGPVTILFDTDGKL